MEKSEIEQYIEQLKKLETDISEDPSDDFMDELNGLLLKLSEEIKSDIKPSTELKNILLQEFILIDDERFNDTHQLNELYKIYNKLYDYPTSTLSIVNNFQNHEATDLLPIERVEHRMLLILKFFTSLGIEEDRIEEKMFVDDKKYQFEPMEDRFRRFELIVSLP